MLFAIIYFVIHFILFFWIYVYDSNREKREVYIITLLFMKSNDLLYKNRQILFLVKYNGFAPQPPTGFEKITKYNTLFMLHVLTHTTIYNTILGFFFPFKWVLLRI